MMQSDATMVRQIADCFDSVFEGETDAPNLMIGTVVSGDKFIEDSETLRWLQREFDALATEMEGAAIGYTCQLNDAPFIIIRGLSDTANVSAPDDFKTNLATVCRHSFRLMERLIPLAGNTAAATPEPLAASA